MSRSLSLRDHILTSLSALPNAHKLHLVALSSTPKRNTSLFPHTPSPPRCFQTDYFVVLGTDVAYGSPALGQNIEAQGEEKKGMNNEEENATTSRMVLTSAVFATLYILPNHGHSILYISKVDSSSYTALSTLSSVPNSTLNPHPTPPSKANPANLPLTRTLITAFISYFLLHQSRPTPSVRVQLFARSQGQYLFPNSAAGKKGLGGGKLCGWWKGVYEDVVRAIVATPNGTETRETNAVQQGAEGTPLISPPPIHKVLPGQIHLSYLLPSYSALEAKGMMGLPRTPLPQGVDWAYEPPFASPIPGIGPSAAGISGKISLADCIPSLEDDPKTRFLDELATDTETRQGGGGTGVTTGAAQQGTDQGGAEAVSSSQTLPQAVSSTSLRTSQPGPASSPSTPTPHTPTPNHLFQPASTPTKPISPSHSSTNTKKPSRRTPKALSAAEDEKYRRQAHSTLSQTTSEEFWERMGYRGECASDVTGFFTLRVSPNSVSTGSAGSESQAISFPPTPSPHGDPTSQKGQLSPAIVHRIHESLLNTDFAMFSLALEGSADWMESMRRIVLGEIGEEGLQLCVGQVQAKEGKELEIMSGKRERSAEKVMVLQPRKKKKV